MLRSMRARLIFYVVLFVVLILGSTNLVVYSYSLMDEEREIQNTSKLALHSVALEIDRHFSVIEYATRMARLTMQSHPEHTDETKRAVKSIMQTDHTLRAAYIAYVPGHVVSADDRLMEYIKREGQQALSDTTYNSLADYDYTQEQWYQEALQQESHYWSEPYIEEEGSISMVTHAQPITNERGETLAVVAVDVTLSSVAYGLNLITPHAGSTLFLLTPQGHLLSTPGSLFDTSLTLAELAREKQATELIELSDSMLHLDAGQMYVEVEDVLMLANFQKVKGTPWSVCMLTPYDELLDEVHPIARILSIVLLVVLLLLVGIIVLIVSRLTQPLQEFARAIRSFSDGQFTAPLPQARDISELEALRQAFAEMQQTLRDYMQRLTLQTRQSERIASELSIANGIQRSLLPHESEEQETPTLRYHALLQPAREVGGDFYDVLSVGEQTYLAIGDVSGKGVPAALLMAVAQTVFRTAAKQGRRPAEIATLMNDSLCAHNDAHMFATCIIAVIDEPSGQLTYCNAGHNYPILLNGQRAALIEEQTDFPLGVVERFAFSEHTLLLEANHSLLLFTDGLNEAEDARHQQYGNERILRTLNARQGAQPKELIEALTADMHSFTGDAAQSDDLTLVCLQRKRTTEPIRLELDIRNEVGELARVAAFAEQLGQEAGWESIEVHQINLVLEELVGNIINYAYPPATQGDIHIEARIDSELTIVLSDAGQPFDPTRQEAPDLSLNAQERSIGGLGIFLASHFMDNIAYERQSERNILTMKKRFSTQP